MNFKQLVRDYFTFSRNERKGIIILLVLIFLLAIANKVIFMFETPAKIDSQLLGSASSKLGTVSDSISRNENGRKLFAFNPNTIDSLALDSLDIPAKVKLNLLKFRNKGGKFYSGDDFRKIYGMTDPVYAQISPFLRFEPIRKRPETDSHEPELFAFDPNTAADADFSRLGLTAKQIITIRHYQEKGGTFTKKEDFLKIYGLTADQKRNFADFIDIKKSERPGIEKVTSVQNLQIELNSADSLQLEQLPGIGKKLSKRIVKYRDLLGGFYSFDQLKEVYGLNEETIRLLDQKLVINKSNIKKLDLNFTDVSELSRHPYLKKKLAGQIVKFRTRYGSIRDLSVLRDSMILNIDEYTRLRPYFQNKND